jgi:hypothetical protein
VDESTPSKDHSIGWSWNSLELPESRQSIPVHWCYATDSRRCDCKIDLELDSRLHASLGTHLFCRAVFPGLRQTIRCVQTNTTQAVSLTLLRKATPRANRSENSRKIADVCRYAPRSDHCRDLGLSHAPPLHICGAATVEIKAISPML